MYCNGVSISAITRIYQVHHSSVRYHLKKAGVYIKGRHGEVDMKDVEKKNPQSSFDFYNTKGEKFKVVRLITPLKDRHWDDHEKNFPKTYKDYVQREKDRGSILLKHGIRDSKVQLPDPHHDSDAFWKRRRRSITDIEERREKTQRQYTYDIRIKDTLS